VLSDDTTNMMWTTLRRIPPPRPRRRTRGLAWGPERRADPGPADRLQGHERWPRLRTGAVRCRVRIRTRALHGRPLSERLPGQDDRGEADCERRRRRLCWGGLRRWGRRD
jgi:hypothetical protein